jgi:hypothetical protein
MQSFISPNRSVPPAMMRALRPEPRRIEVASSTDPALTCVNFLILAVSYRKLEVGRA